MRRLQSVLLIVILASPAFAGPFSGTKVDPVSPATAQTNLGLSLMPLVQMSIALLLVLGLMKFLLPRIVAKSQRKVGSAGSMLAVQESLPLGGSMLHVVSVGDSRVLLASSTQGISLLMKLDVEEPSEEQAFFEALDEAESEDEVEVEAPKAFRPTTAAAHVRVNDVDEALARLNRLSR